MVNLLDGEFVADIVNLTHRSALIDHRFNVDDFGANELVNLSVEAPHVQPFDVIDCIVWYVCDISHYTNRVCIVLYQDANSM